jgi:hypothetical protein
MYVCVKKEFNRLGYMIGGWIVQQWESAHLAAQSKSLEFSDMQLVILPQSEAERKPGELLVGIPAEKLKKLELDVHS